MVRENMEDWVFPIKEKFTLTENFLEEFKTKKVDWNDLAYITYKRSYAREIPDENRLEEWWETCRRVVEGVYTIQMNHCKKLYLPWSNHAAQASAKEMYRLMFEFKWLPPGRGLYNMGDPTIYKRGAMSLYNCSFISTVDIDFEFSDPFHYMMDLGLAGVGIGFDVLGQGKVLIKEPKISDEIYVVEDSKEGWANLIRIVMDPYVHKGKMPKEIDYSQIRPEGSPIKTSGGIAPGPEPLKLCIQEIKNVLNNRIGEKITSSDLIDIQNLIGRCVVSGGKRRIAQICLGDADDEEYMNLKNPNINKEKVMSHRWASNNSVYAYKGMDYSESVKQFLKSGDPGFFYLDNHRNYGRFKDGYQKDIDAMVMGTNPSLRKGTKVHTTNGIFSIEDLEGKEFEVINLNNKISKAKCFLSGKNKQLYKIKLQGGHEIYCTKEHKWPVYEINKNKNIKNEYKKYTTDEIPVGGFLPLPFQNKLFDGNIGTRDEGFLIGWNIGDGWQTKRSDNNKMQYGFIVSEFDNKSNIGNKLESILEQYGSNAKFNKDGELNTQNKNLEELFSKFKVQNKKDGLPKSIWNETTEEFRIGLLDGLFSSDGCFSDRILFTTAYNKLAKDVSELLGFYGIKNSIKYKHIKNPNFPNNKVYNREYDCYEVCVSNNESKRHFKNLIDKLTHKEKNEKLNNLINEKINKLKYEKIKILSVEKTDLFEDVWDITVYDDIHCFRIANCITGNCGEVSLASAENCNLSELFPARHETFEEFKRSIKYAYLYSKTVTILPTHNMKVNVNILKNRRLGISMSGITQAIEKFGPSKFFNWCDMGYEFIKEMDKKYSDWLCIPRSIKLSSIKPSGTISLLASASPGVHFPHSEYYIRRVEIQKNSPLVEYIKKSGYNIVDSIYKKESYVIEFPVKTDNYSKGKNEVSVYEQMEIGAKMQYYWADNSVSQTVTVKKEEESQLEYILQMYEDRVKAVSFLSLNDHSYEQAPYETITKEQYEEMIKNIKPIDFSNVSGGHDTDEKFCSNDSCTI